VAARVPCRLHGHDHGQAQGQPGWLKPWFDFWINVQHPRVMFFAYLVSVVETLIALALIAGFARKITYISAATFSVLIWATAEGFGGPYTSGAADIGTAIIYAVVFAGLLALSYYSGPARYRADYYLEKKISWWRRAAEVRRPVPATAAAPPAPEAVPVSPGAVPAQRTPQAGQPRTATSSRS
jgi:nitrite reductase (NO-forming)